MRKLKSFCMLLAALVLLTACGQNTPQPSLYDRGMETIALLDEAIRCEAYLDMLSASENLRVYIDDAASGDYSTPAAVYAVSFAADPLLLEPEVSSDLPEALSDLVRHRMIATVTTQINAYGGMEFLAASSMCTVGKTFVSTDFAEDIIYLYVFEQGVPVAVTFTGGEDHTVSASASFLFSDKFPTSDAQSIQNFFGNGVVTVTDITGM